MNDNGELNSLTYFRFLPVWVNHKKRWTNEETIVDRFRTVIAIISNSTYILLRRIRVIVSITSCIILFATLSHVSPYGLHGNIY